MLVFVTTKLVAVRSVAPKSVTTKVLALIFVANRLAAEIKDVTNKLEVVTPVASRDPVLEAVATRFVVVASVANSSAALILVENRLDADINSVTNNVEVVIPPTLKDGAEISLFANKLPPI
jgi:hypothetical protein